MDIIEYLSTRFNLHFKDKQLILNAFTHSSYLNETHEEGTDYERLEFLGDSVVDVWVSNRLFKHTPNIPEGKMTTMRAQLVCEVSLAKFANKLELGKYIRVGVGEEKNGARTRASLLADIFEAMIGAVYLDCGYNAVDKILSQTIDIVDHPELTGVVDYKSQLQEYVQTDVNRVLKYTVISEKGPSNNPCFEVAVYLDDVLLGVGKEHTKKKAEQLAAKIAIGKLVK